MPKRHGKTFFLAFGFFGIIGLIYFALKPWEWSLMDDTNFYKRIHDSISAEGFTNGIVSNFWNLAAADKAWGLFRPSWWAYASTVYILEPQAAHFVRLLILEIALFIPLWILYLDRKKTANWVLVASLSTLLVNRPLYEGLYHVSLQEFSALLPAAFGFFFNTQLKGKKRGLLTASMFLLAAFFKAPFIWLLFVYGIILVVSERKLLEGIVWITLSVAAILVFSTWAKMGYYTGSRFSLFNFSNWLITLKNTLIPASYLGMLFVLYLMFWRPRFSKGLFQSWDRIDWTGALCLTSGIFYYLNLMPWAASGYYLSPPLYLIGVGIIFLFWRRSEKLSNRFKHSIIMVSIVILAAFVFSRGLWKVFVRDSDVRGARDWALTLPLENQVFLINAEEGSHRFNEIMVLRTDGKWKNKTKFDQTYQKSDGSYDYYIVNSESPWNPQYCEKVLFTLKKFFVCSSKN